MMKRLAAGLAAWMVCFSAACQQVIPTVNVRQFGARGDDAVDDTAAIQLALNSIDAKAFSTVIYFPRGVYKLTGTLYAKSGSSRLMLLGDGKTGSDSVSQLHMTDANKTIFDCSTNAINVLSIRGLQFQGTGKGTGTGNGVVLGNSSTTMFDSTIQDCWFVGIPDTCIKGIRMADYQIINNGIEGSGQGVVIDNTSVGGTYVDYVAINNISGNTFYSLNTAARLQFVYGSRINNNVFNICGTDTATNAAVVIERLGTNVESRNNLISGNVFDRNWNDIYLHGDGTLGAHTGVSGVLVSGNSSDFANRSFAVVDGANECIFTGNKVNDCSAVAILYPAFYVTGTTIRPGFFDNVVTKNGSFGPTYGLFCDANVSQINLGHNRWLGNTADVRIEGTTEARGDVQASAVGISIGAPFGTATLPMGYQWGLFGTNGFVAGAAGDIKVTGTGKQAILGYDFGLDASILRSVNQGVAYKPFNVDGSPMVFNQNSGAYSDFQALRSKGSTAPTTGKGLEFGYNSSATNGTIVSFDRDNSLYARLSLDGSAITLQPHSTSAYVGIGVPIGAAPSERLQITSGNIALDNNSFLKLKDTGGTSENVIGIDGANNLLLGSPGIGGGGIIDIRKGDQTLKARFATNTVPWTLSSNLFAITAALTASKGATVTGGITNNGAAGAKGTLDIFATNSSSYVRIQTPDQVSTYTITLPGTNVSGYLYNPADGNPAKWTSLSGTPGGSDTYVQFNDGGSFGGDAGFKYSKSTKVLTLTNLVASLPVYTDALSGITNNLVTGVGATVQSNAPSLNFPVIKYPVAQGIMQMQIGFLGDEGTLAFVGSSGTQSNRDWAIYPILDSTGTNYTFRIATYAATAGTTNQPAIDITRANTNITGIKFWAPIDAPNQTGSGNFMRTRVGVVRSIDLPMGAWLTNGIAAPATPASWTNTADSFQFADGVTNTLRIRFPLPLNWNAGVVRAQFVMGSTLTNATTSTNVVFGIKGATILGGGTEDSLTFGTQITVTNHVHRSPYVSTVCTTSDITVGNSPAANKDIVWELTRMTSDSVDVNTNTVSVLDAQFFYTETATEPSMPASTN